MPKSYQQIDKKNCFINNQVTYPIFISNEFSDFLESIWIFLLRFWNFFWKFWQMNVTLGILDMFSY